MKNAKLLVASLLASAPLLGHSQMTVVEGPYLDAGTGANFSRDQGLYNNAGQRVGTLQYDGGAPGTLAAGYAFASGWRGDLEFGFRRNDVDDSAGTTNDGSVDAGSLMAMLWFDWPMPWAVRPYAGAGVGQAQLDLNRADGGSGESDRVFAWQLSAGFVSQVSRHFAMTLGYRLLNADDAQFAGSGLRADYTADSAMLGLRYFFRPVDRIRFAEAAPAAAPAAEVAAFEVVLRPVNFQFDQDELTEPARWTLDEIASRLQRAPDMKVTIDGHTDFIGSTDYNIALGERRANMVRDYLAAKGVDAQMIEVRSFGELQPSDTNETAEGRALNRRAEISTAGAPPQNVRITVAPPTPESKAAAQDPGDPLARDERAEPAPGSTKQ